MSRKCENAKIGGHCDNDLEDIYKELLEELEDVDEEEEEQVAAITQQLSLVEEGFCCGLCEEEYWRRIRSAE